MHRATTRRLPGRRVARLVRLVLTPVLLGLLGGLAGIQLGAHISRDIGPVSASMSLEPSLPKQAQYAVCMAYRIRFMMQLNARAAMHLIELRSSPQGHPAYRAVAHEMHRLIAEVAGHRLVADAMRFVDFDAVDLERLEAERRAERKRHGSSPPS